MSTPRNPHYQRPCYHCRKNEPNRHSIFCDECLSIANRPVLFFGQEKQRTPVLTKLLYIGATAALGWLIYETIEYVMP